MLSYLRQSTASQGRTIGPFVDDTDFKTPENALTINASDIRLKKNGAADVAKNSGGGTADTNGLYGVTFDATDTDTIGELSVSVLVSGALLVIDKYWVLPPLAYDAMFGGTTVNNGIGFGRIWAGTLSAVADGTITFPASNNISQQAQIIVELTGGTNALGKARYATYSGTDEVWNVDPAWNSGGETTPTGTVTAIVTYSPKYPTSVVPGVNTIQLSGDATAADNAEAFFDGTGYAGTNNVIPAVTSVTALAGSAGIKKNTAKAGFMFLMTDSTLHAPATGLTVTATRSLDGAAFGACANAVSEVASGWYKINLAAGDLNGDTVALKFTATGADATNISIVTGP